MFIMFKQKTTVDVNSLLGACKILLPVANSLTYPPKAFGRSFALKAPDFAAVDSVDKRSSRSSILLFPHAQHIKHPCR